MGFAAKYQPASFRKVPFLVETESVQRGKKYVIHNYPNSDQRYVEELGKEPQTFTVRAIVHGQDAINQRIRLENALEQKGIGLLVHPIYGELNVMALTVNVSSNQTEIGIFSFDITFSQSLENISAAPATPTANELSGKADSARKVLNSKISEVYTNPISPYNYNKILDTTQGVLDNVHDKISVVTDLSSEGSANFTREYRAITNGLTRIVSDANEIRDNLTDFYAAALDAPVYVEQLGNAWDNILDYPLTIPISSSLTREQKQRRQNDITVTEHMKLTALIGSYESKAHADYTTDDELTAARKLLDTNYRYLLTQLNNDISDVDLESLANDPDIRTALTDLRVTARQVFDEKEKAVFMIIDVNPGRSSMALSCFRYYGTLENITNLTGLNPSINHANFKEFIKALTS